MAKESTIPKGGFEDSEQVMRWLCNLPDSESYVFARIISARSAQRVLPLLGSLFQLKLEKTEFAANMVIASLRSNSVSRIAAQGTMLNIQMGLIWAAHYALDAIEAARAGSSDTTAKFGIPSTDLTKNSKALADFSSDQMAKIAVDTAASAVISVRSGASARSAASSAVASAARPAPYSAWAFVTRDARALEAGATPEEMAARPLWPEGSPYKHRFNRKTFLAAAPSFEVWLDWYEPIVDGKAPWGLPRDVANKLETLIALGDGRGTGGKDFWDRDADEVNAEIEAWVDAARAEVAAATAQDSDSIEIAQDPTAAIMVATDQGQIDRAPIPISQRLLDTPEQRKEYANCRNDVLQLIDYGPNQLGRLSPQLAAMLDAMPIAFVEANTIDFWRAMNRLRRTYNSHLNAADPLPGDNAYLNPDVAEDLGAIVDLLNVFASFDPALRERDYRRIAPQDRPAIFEERLLGMPIVEAVIAAEEILTPNAQTEIKNSIESASDAIATEHGSQALDQQNRTTRNMFGALMDVARNGLMRTRVGSRKEIGFAWTEFRSGAYKAAGAGTISLIGSEIIGLTQFHLTALKFISENWTTLSIYASQVIGNPKIVELIEFISKLMN